MPQVRAGSWRVRYREAGGGDSTIVLVHGAGTSSLLWLRVLPELSRGGRVLALDLPGHGQTEGCGLGRVELYREVVRAFVLALGLERPALAGHSMGGAIALDYALAYPGELQGLGLCASAASFDLDPEVLELLEQGGPAFVRHFAGVAFGARVGLDRAVAATRDLLTATAPVLLADFRACAAFDLRRRLAEIRIPTVVAAGDEDRVTPPCATEALHRGIAGADLETFAGHGHMLPWEAPAALAAALHPLISSAR